MDSASSSEREFHLVVWGATGFTGKQACKFLAMSYGLPNDEFKYAIAARTQSRLDDVEASMITVATHNASKSVTKILASVDDEASIVSMCKRTSCLLALAGPYALCGEAVLKACAENGTHYVDATGEANWLVNMRKVYNAKAISTNAKIIPGCGGLEFMPNEAAMIFLDRMCKERNLELHAVRQHVEMESAGVSGGTLRSLFGMFKALSFTALRDSCIDPYILCSERPPQAIVDANKISWCSMSYISEARMWSAPSFISPQMATYIRWSNEVQNFPWNRHLVVQVSQLSSNFFIAAFQQLVLWLFPLTMFVLSRSPFASKFFPQSGKSTFDPCNVGKKSYVKVLICADALDKSSKTLKKIVCKLNCPFELYYLTAMSTVEAAMTAIYEKTPENFGVTSPSGALGESYLTRLQNKGIIFSATSMK